MQERHVSFKSEELTLEGLLAAPAKAAGAAVVCHPHPQYGGSMHNNVVEAVLAAFWAVDYTTLRFNFRGVGRSEGAFADGVGEISDARAAVEFLAAESGVKQAMVMAGYSFGATVGLRAGLESTNVGTIIAVAPAIALVDLSFLVGTDKRIILIAGDGDQYCPAAQLRALHKKLTGPSAIKVIKGADHFFWGHEGELTNAVREALSR
ncbi:MAG TPA: alpha/beta fold hydrolase [Candidatus Binataceae bacterium]|nr:alpha/beta fold hydrolase [Candidatus Binataceae bacterium]